MPAVKKSVVIILVLVAAIVLVSPGIVGRLAERSMDENLNWAASEAGAVKVTSEHFERGWFSSAGQHRVELREGDLLAMLQLLAGPMVADDLPVLIINTRLDHGLIPVSSMSREQGSLAPGLGSAVSTLQVEFADGDVIDLPGTIYSKVALNGELESSYVLEPGSRSDGDATAEWSNVKIDVTTNPANGKVSHKGDLGMVSVAADGSRMILTELRFNGRQQPTHYGVTVGDLYVSLDGMAYGEPLGVLQDGDVVARVGDEVFQPAGGVRSLRANAQSSLDGDRYDASATLNTEIVGAPQFDEMKVDFAVTLIGADAAAVGAIQRAAEAAAGTADPMAMYATLENDAKTLFANGFDFSIDRMNVTVPQGKVTSSMRFSFAASDPATFAWTSLLLGTEATIDLSIPVALADLLGADNPQLAMAIGGGYLVRKGDDYVLNAQMKKGLLTINGAPMPIPLGVN